MITDFVFQPMEIVAHGKLGVLVLKVVAQEAVSELAIVMIHHRWMGEKNVKETLFNERRATIIPVRRRQHQVNQDNLFLYIIKLIYTFEIFCKYMWYSMHVKIICK